MPSDKKLASTSRDARYTFVLLITQADDAGLIAASHRKLLGDLYPHDECVTIGDLLTWLEELVDIGAIRWRETHDGMPVIELVNWKKHQRIDNASKSKLAEVLKPFTETRGDSPQPAEVRGLDVDLGVGVGVGGGDGRGSGAEGRAAVQDVPEDPPPPRVEFPPQCQAFLDLFYPARSEAERERYLNVKRQLYDVLDPKHPGPKIRGGVRVKARSVEHLLEVIERVTKDPPMDRDMAIVFVLKKLVDPPRGPSAAEIASDQDKARLAREEQYHAAMRAAGLAWSKDHAEEYERIRAEVDAEFRTSMGSLIGRLARDAALAQRCGVAAGFPDFDTWHREVSGLTATGMAFAHIGATQLPVGDR